VKFGSLLVVALTLAGCSGYPDTVRPVEGFELQRYLGKWYEIARLDHRFERGLSNVTAEYSLNPDGSVRVLNRGFNAEAGEWEEAQGRALFVEESDIGYLKVSFFGPFYGSYVIFELGPDYQFAFVSGPDTGYLWLLSRTPVVGDAVYARFLERSGAAGFNIDELIRVEQQP
jgi:apolipoprotein D and lipocalin family protein